MYTHIDVLCKCTYGFVYTYYAEQILEPIYNWLCNKLLGLILVVLGHRIVDQGAKICRLVSCSALGF
jgi:hypothetical protein